MPVINLTTAKGGINRLRTVGSPSPENLYDLVNGYVNASGAMQSRPGTELDITLPAGTKGLCAFDNKLYVFGIASASTGNALYEVAVTVHPTLPTLALDKIHFAAPFLGSLYVVAEFVNGDIVHYWLQAADAWAANTTYMEGDVVEPTTPNGLAYRASYNGTPLPKWAPNVERNLGDQVVPTVANGYGYEVIGLVSADGVEEGDGTQPGPPPSAWVVTGDFPAGVAGDEYDWTSGTGLTISGGPGSGQSSFIATSLPTGITLFCTDHNLGLQVRGKTTATAPSVSLTAVSWLVLGEFEPLTVTKTLTIGAGSGTDVVKTMWNSATIDAALNEKTYVTLSGITDGHKISTSAFLAVDEFGTFKAMAPKSSGKWLAEACFMSGYRNRCWFGLVLDGTDISDTGDPIGKLAGSLGVLFWRTPDLFGEVWYDNALVATIPRFSQGGFDLAAAVCTLAFDATGNSVGVYQGGVLVHTQALAAGTYAVAFSGNAASGIALNIGTTLYPVATYSDWTL